MRTPILFSLMALALLTGCEQVQQQLGLEDPAKKEARAEGEGKAVGGACRQSGRAIEDCYSIYSWLPKAAVFAGWRDMDEYMRENNLDTITPQLPPPEPPSAKKKKKVAPPPEEGEKVAEPSADKPADKAGEKPAAKPAEAPAKH